MSTDYLAIEANSLLLAKVFEHENDFKDTVVRQAIELRKTVSKETQSHLRKVIKKSGMRIAGWSNIYDAPSSKILQQLGSSGWEYANLLTALLGVWVESEPTLTANVTAFLQDVGTPVTPFSVQDFQIEAVQAHSTFESLYVQEFIERFPDASVNCFKLMFCCLTRMAPIPDNDYEELLGKIPASHRGNEDFWTSVLNHFEQSSSASHSWENMEDFVQALGQIKAYQLMTANLVELQSALAELTGTFEPTVLAYYGLEDAQTWDAHSIENSSRTDVTEVLKNLTQTISTYESIRCTAASSLMEERIQREQLEILEQDIILLIDQLSVFRTTIADASNRFFEPDLSRFTDTPLESFVHEALRNEGILWDNLDNFVEELLRMRETAFKHSRELEEASTAISQLHNLSEDIISFFGILDIVTWPDTLPQNQILDMAEDLKSLTDSIAEYSELLHQRGSTLSAERERRQQVELLETRIEKLVRTLRSMHAANSTGTRHNVRTEETGSPSGGTPRVTTDQPSAETRPQEISKASESENIEHSETKEVDSDALIKEPDSARDKLMFEATLPYLACNVVENSEASHFTAAIQLLVWRLLLENRLSMAYQLLRALDESGRHTSPVPAWLIQMLLLGRHVRYPDSEIASIIKKNVADFFKSSLEDLNSRSDLSLLIVAASLRPTLLTPVLEAGEVLKLARIPRGLSRLYDFSQLIIEFAKEFRSLDPTTLVRVKDDAGFELSLNRLQADLARWRNNSRSIGFNFHPAQLVWNRWHERGNLFDSLLQPILEDEVGQIDALKEFLQTEFSSDASMRSLVERTYNEEAFKRGKSKVNKSFQPRALGSICMRLRDVANFLTQWIALHDARQSNPRDYNVQRTQRLSHELISMFSEVHDELEDFKSRSADMFESIAAAQIQFSLHNIRDLFDPSLPLETHPVGIKYIQNFDLLKLAEIDLNEDWDPIAPSEVLMPLLNHLVRGESDWIAAYQSNEERWNHQRTGFILDYVRSTATSEDDTIGELQARRQNHIEDCRNTLARHCESVSNQIEVAVAYGLLDEKDRINHKSNLEGILDNLDSIQRFDVSSTEIRDIEAAIEQAREVKKEEVSQRLEIVAATCSPENLDRLRDTIKVGDILTANEYIDLLISGQQLPGETSQRDVFRDFFYDKVRRIENYLEETKVSQILDDIKNGRTVATLLLSEVPGKQRDEAAKMMHSWFTLKRLKGAPLSEHSKHIETIFNSLGFNVKATRVKEKRSDSQIWIDIETVPIEDRAVCPVPEFGSQARGHYRLICMWDRPPEDRMVADIGKTAVGGPAIVLYLGRMSEQRCRDLAQQCQLYRSTFIVIDEKLLLYLCGERGLRLPALFECTLPFTFVEPYTITSSTLPPEMFYGRAREKNSIIDLRGSSFIYGGRQLGKTVLLRSVEREFHDPESRRIAIWIDLKAEGIGYARPPSDIWQLISAQLSKAHGSIMGTVLSNPKQILEKIEQWLDQRPSSRVLLLLDEADRFLEADGKNEFELSTTLKGWMDKTDRRLKVVFAGLHNVLRTTTQSNNPLAQLGEPICIGPLLDGGDWREARRLIEFPMHAMGFRFESVDLATRILSQTNYYPSLIQIYIHHMLSLYESNGRYPFDNATHPPRIISSKQVDEAYKQRNLLNLVRERFKLTLHLDQRYDVIANVIAWQSLLDRESAPQGLDVSTIRKLALDFWADGFVDDQHDDAFRVLLQEMEGLGVLRVTESNNWALRSPNVGLLMGTLQEIEEALQKPRSAPIVYAPSQFRSVFKARDHARRSPFTAQQEASFRFRQHKTSIVFGTRIAGLDDVIPYLKSAFENEPFHLIEYVVLRTDFVQRLELILSERVKDGVSLVVISHNCGWDQSWVDDARERLKRLTAKKAAVQVLFVADPGQTRTLLRDPQFMHQAARMEDLTLLSLTSWQKLALQQWLEDCSFVTDDVMKPLADVTGSWPLLIYRFYDASRKSPHKWREAVDNLRTYLHDPSNREEIFSQFGVNSDELRVFQEIAIWQQGDMGVSESDLTDLLKHEIPVDVIKHSLRYAETMHLATSQVAAVYRLDNILAQLLVNE